MPRTKLRSARPSAPLRLRVRHDLERHRRGRWHVRRRGAAVSRLRRRWQRLRTAAQRLPRWLGGTLAAVAFVATASLAGYGQPARADHFAPGAHFEGVPLGIDHPLQQRADELSAALVPSRDIDAAEAAAAAPAALALRKNCRWGQPGRSPYRGSVEQALAAAGVPADATRLIAAKVHGGVESERLSIGNDGIRGNDSGRVFNPKKVALSYGKTMCLDAQVNFPAGHREPASLYEATDAEGRHHAVMVPDVCGNVSVLSDAAEASEEVAAGGAEDGRRGARAVGDGSAGAVGSSTGGSTQAVPLPGTLWHVLAGIALLAAFKRRR